MSDHDRNRANRKDALEARIVSTLEADCSALDPQLRGRLDRIRAEALACAPAGQPVRRFRGPGWRPMAAGVAAAAIALALAVVLIDQSPEIDSPPVTADLDVLTDPQFELFVEDPEFVAWIAEAEPENQSAESSG